MRGVVELFAAASVLASCTRVVDVGDNERDAGLDDGGSIADAGAPPSGDASDGATTDADDSDAPYAGPFYVFVTRGVYNASFGGIPEADQDCQDGAKAAALHGKYVAWISDSGHDARDHVTGNGPWLEVGTSNVLFASHDQLLGFPSAAITTDEYGTPATDRWWTGTSINGTRNTATCLDWTSSDQFQSGMTGTRTGSGMPGNEWTEDTAFSCVTSDSQKFALICLGE